MKVAEEDVVEVEDVAEVEEEEDEQGAEVEGEPHGDVTTTGTRTNKATGVRTEVGAVEEAGEEAQMELPCAVSSPKAPVDMEMIVASAMTLPAARMLLRQVYTMIIKNLIRCQMPRPMKM